MGFSFFLCCVRSCYAILWLETVKCETTGPNGTLFLWILGKPYKSRNHSIHIQNFFSDPKAEFSLKVFQSIFHLIIILNSRVIGYYFKIGTIQKWFNLRLYNHFCIVLQFYHLYLLGLLWNYLFPFIYHL